MLAVMNRPRTARAGVLMIPVDEIDPNPMQPRSDFNEEGLRDLAASIAEYGILNPLNVRLHYGRYELVAGERRLRAARLAGLKAVPCTVLDVDMEVSSLLAMVENIQREDLDFVEEARGIATLIRLFDMRQDEAAKKLGLSQSAVANKLRLLKLQGDILSSLRENGLTERHGRALLRLSSENDQRSALAHIITRDLNVAQTDAYIDRLLEEKSGRNDRDRQRRAFVMKDVRLFLNTITKSLDMMKQGGVNAGLKKSETDDELILTISIPKK
ncbi:MAG: ParB/RepB/Spo0J family partition protein [Clostridia bacterium]|nr:ParB/RepB/Spo0J family partition protein [Clostridia bacterium]NCC67932.1 ParB/RepB/Spo0J family partition protein [Clostridia bacterium]